MTLNRFSFFPKIKDTNFILMTLNKSFLSMSIIICAREAKADIGLPVADYDYYVYDPGIKCTKLA